MIEKDDVRVSLVMKDAYELAKSHTEHPDDALMVAGAFLNVSRTIYIDVLGTESARKFFKDIVDMSFTINNKKPTMH